VLNVVPVLPQNPKKKMNEWFAMLTKLYRDNTDLIQKLIHNRDLVSWLLNLLTKCPEPQLRLPAVRFFQTIFQDIESKVSRKKSIKILCEKMCKAVKHIAPLEMPTKSGKRILPGEFFWLLKNLTLQRAMLPYFHKYRLLYELSKLCCRDDRRIRTPQLPRHVQMLDNKSALDYDLLFELIANLIYLILRKHMFSSTYQTRRC